VLIVFISVGVIRSRKRVWAQFARRHGLSYQSTATQVQVQGSVQGRPFRLFTAHESSDDGAMGIQQVRMQLGLRGRLPPDTRVSRVQGWVAAVDRLAGMEAVPTGDDRFAEAVLVESAHPEQAKAYLNDHRRELILRLVSDAHADDAGIEGTSLFVQDREMLTDIERLERRLDLMLSLAPELDATGPST